jgi:hypothetical protein
MTMATIMGCPEEVVLGGADLAVSGDPSEKISFWPLRPLWCVADIGSGESPGAPPSLPVLQDREKY